MELQFHPDSAWKLGIHACRSDENIKIDLKIILCMFMVIPCILIR